MQEWLSCFLDDPDSTLLLNGTSIKTAKCLKLGHGSQKSVYKIPEQDTCFFIPHKLSTEENWNYAIKTEKHLLDGIINLGLKAQNFDIAPLTIKSSKGESYTIKVLITKDFNSLCEKESIVIYNHKALKRVNGTPPPIYKVKDRFKDKSYIQQMLKKITNEYAIAASFKLPISSLNTDIDDSQHFCLELAQDPNDPPIARFMFWDVVGDYVPIKFPLVPTLQQLKSGPADEKYSTGRPLDIFASSLADAIKEMANDEIDKLDTTNDLPSVCMDLYDALFTAIKDALENDEFLSQSLFSARKAVVDFFSDDYLASMKIAIIQHNELFKNIMFSAISTSNLDLVKKCLALNPNPGHLNKETINTLIDACLKYKNHEVSEYVTKQLFLQKYHSRLSADKSHLFGLNSFFVTSHVRDSMSLQELIEQAQGNSKQSTDARSQTIMRELDWLDTDNKLSHVFKELLSPSSNIVHPAMSGALI